MSPIVTLESIIWLTMVFSFITFFLLLFMRRASYQEAKIMSELIDQDKKLSDSISLLRDKIFDLDRDLKRLAKNNESLRNEIRKLSERVNNLQVRIRECENETCNY